MKKFFALVLGLLCVAACGFGWTGSGFEEVEREDFGAVAKTVVTSSTSVKARPDYLAADVCNLAKGTEITVTGFSDEKVKVGRKKGYWLKVSLWDLGVDGTGLPFDNNGFYGWVFSADVSMPSGVEVSLIRAVGPVGELRPESTSLQIELDRNGDKSVIRVNGMKFKDQADYCFVWSDDQRGFRYCDPVGTFRWNPETNEITHLTDMGYDIESNFCIVSDDGRYFFQSLGSNSGVHSIMVRNVATGERLFSGYYSSDLEYDGESITVCEDCSNWNVSRGYVSEESVAIAEEYKASHPEINFSNHKVIVYYRLNLVTREKSFLRAEAMYVQ